MRKSMDRICQHCGKLIVRNAYRVTSEEEGITLLNMIVCSLCFMEAKRLDLHAEEIDVEANILQLETGGVTIRDSTINFNTGSVTSRFPVLLNVVDCSTRDERS